MSTPITAFESVRVVLRQATEGSDILHYFRIFLNDAHSVHTSADTHILTLDIELDPVQSNGAVMPTSPPDGQRDTVFARFFESAKFDTEAQEALLRSVESSGKNQLGDGVSKDQISSCNIKATISGKFVFQDFVVCTSVDNTTKHDWEPLWRNLMERKLAESQDIARSLERAFASIDVNDDCAHHLEPISLIENRISGFAVRMDDHVEYRSVQSQAFTVRCRQPIRDRLSLLDKVSGKIAAMLRDRTVSDAWNQDVAAQLEGVVNQDEGAESGSGSAFDPEDDASHDLAFAGGRIEVILGQIDV